MRQYQLEGISPVGTTFIKLETLDLESGSRFRWRHDVLVERQVGIQGDHLRFQLGNGLACLFQGLLIDAIAPLQIDHLLLQIGMLFAQFRQFRRKYRPGFRHVSEAETALRHTGHVAENSRPYAKGKKNQKSPDAAAGPVPDDDILTPVLFA